MKEGTALPVFLKLSRDSPSGVMCSPVIPPFGDKAQFRMAEGCLSVVKSQSSWEREAGNEKSVQCQPFPGTSLSGEGPLVVQNLKTDLLHTTYAWYSQEDCDSKEPRFYLTKWAVQEVQRKNIRNSIYTCSCILIDLCNLHKSEMQ